MLVGITCSGWCCVRTEEKRIALALAWISVEDRWGARLSIPFLADSLSTVCLAWQHIGLLIPIPCLLQAGTLKEVLSGLVVLRAELGR